MKLWFLLFALALMGCQQSEDLLAHWRCSDGSYHRTMEECYQNKCVHDADCAVAFYESPCGKILGAFPNKVIPPRFESKRCSGEICSIQTPGCTTPSIVVARCKEEKCVAAEKESIVLSGKEFHVAVAITQEEHAKGLMLVPSMADNEGMLFVFEKPVIPAFWMKNMLIPLDIIFIDKNKEIISIETAEPCREEPCKLFSPPREAAFALEVNADTAAKLNITAGQRINTIRDK